MISCVPIKHILPYFCHNNKLLKYLYFLSDGEDFIAIDDVFVISPGQTELVVPIALVDDVFPEGVEVFEVLLSTSPGVFIDSPSRATVTILNDDRDLLGIVLHL